MDLSDWFTDQAHHQGALSGMTLQTLLKQQAIELIWAWAQPILFQMVWRK